MKKILVVFIFSIILFSCKSDQENIKNNTPKWFIGYLKDEFGDDTDVLAISRDKFYQGTFENEYIQNGKSYINFIIDEFGNIEIILYKNDEKKSFSRGRMNVKYGEEVEKFDINKKNNGKYYLQMRSNDLEFILRNNDNIKIRIDSRYKYDKDIFLFNIDANNFKAISNELKELKNEKLISK